MEWRKCSSCEVSYPKASLTKKGECVMCDPPYKVKQETFKYKKQ